MLATENRMDAVAVCHLPVDRVAEVEGPQHVYRGLDQSWRGRGSAWDEWTLVREAVRIKGGLGNNTGGLVINCTTVTSQ